MASVFDLFGTLDFKTGSFEQSARQVAARLDNLDDALDGTISKSNKLGDTSATVARRYEKLSDQIKAQRQRLLDNAVAFEAGDISAKKFSAVLTSVDKATASLNSRIKDARARVQELNDTGLTHFQNQIAGAVDVATNKLENFRQQIIATQATANMPANNSLWGKLSGQQKTQLSFQLNDVITGLASGQSPFQVLAQQGGQIVQIFQQGKQAQEGVAAATTTAATAQTAFAASTQASVAPMASIATSSQATAAATEASAASATVLGASVVSLGATLAAGLVTILAVYKGVKDIEEAAKKRLARELEITAEYNKQNLALAELQKRLKEAADARRFSNFTGGDDIPGLQMGLATRQDERARLAREVQNKQAYYNTLLQIPGLKASVLEQAFPKAEQERLKKLDDEIVAISERLAGLKQEQKDSYRDNLFDSVIKQGEAARKAVADNAVAQIKAEQEVAEKRKKNFEEAKKKAEELAEKVKRAGDTALSVFASTSGNPFVKIFAEGETAVQRMVEATKGLGTELQKTLANLIDAQTQSKAFEQSMKNALEASNLRSEAGQFLGKPKESLDESIKRQLGAIGANRLAGAGGAWINLNDPNLLSKWSVTSGQDLRFVNPSMMAAAANAEEQRIRDQKIIELTKGLADSELSPALKQQAAAARIREADRLKNEEPEALKVQKELLTVLNTLNKNKALTIDINDPNQRTTVVNATPQTVQTKYNQKK